jgi:hypothetical protein
MQNGRKLRMSIVIRHRGTEHRGSESSIKKAPFGANLFELQMLTFMSREVSRQDTPGPGRPPRGRRMPARACVARFQKKRKTPTFGAQKDKPGCPLMHTV